MPSPSHAGSAPDADRTPQPSWTCRHLAWITYHDVAGATGPAAGDRFTAISEAYHRLVPAPRPRQPPRAGPSTRRSGDRSRGRPPRSPRRRSVRPGPADRSCPARSPSRPWRSSTVPGSTTMNGDRNRPLYGISVASELTRVDPQALRGHEAKGLVERARTEGGTRRCSRHDLDRINKITALLYGRLTWPGLPGCFSSRPRSVGSAASRPSTRAAAVAGTGIEVEPTALNLVRSTGPSREVQGGGLNGTADSPSQ